MRFSVAGETQKPLPWASQDLDAKHRRMSKEMAKQKLVGVKRPKTVITCGETVVTPVTDHEPNAVKLNVLVRLKGGLRIPWQEDVFCLH